MTCRRRNLFLFGCFFGSTPDILWKLWERLWNFKQALWCSFSSTLKFVYPPWVIMNCSGNINSTPHHPSLNLPLNTKKRQLGLIYAPWWYFSPYFMLLALNWDSGLLYILILMSVFLDAEKLWSLQPACQIWCCASLLFPICDPNNRRWWVTRSLL